MVSPARSNLPPVATPPEKAKVTKAPPVELSPESKEATATRSETIPTRKEHVAAVMRKGRHTLLGNRGDYILGLDILSTTLSRDATIATNNTGEFLNRRDNNELIGTADGTTYDLTLEYQYTVPMLKFGFQEENDGNFYFVGFYSGDVMQETLFVYGITAPSLTRGWLTFMVPYLKTGVGFGHTDSDGIFPTNYGGLLGVGLRMHMFDDIDIGLGYDYQYRQWLDLEMDYGTEQWTDTATTIYFSVDYRF